MACDRARVSPNEQTKVRLFASSAGHCQNPNCLRRLFENAGETQFHIAEMAHIVAASKTGPRPTPIRSVEYRSSYDNLILLCPNCHTTVDKAPNYYTEDTIKEWKLRHEERIAAAFGATECSTRVRARALIEPFLSENQTIFHTYGPNNDYRSNPESPMAATWRRKVYERILPNNRRLLSILDANRIHLNAEEESTLELFRQHIDDLEARHLGENHTGTVQFPRAMDSILK